MTSALFKYNNSVTSHLQACKNKRIDVERLERDRHVDAPPLVVVAYREDGYAYPFPGLCAYEFHYFGYRPEVFAVDIGKAASVMRQCRKDFVVS